MAWKRPKRKTEQFGMKVTPKFKADLSALSEHMEVPKAEVLDFLVTNAAKRRGLNQ